MRLALAKWLLEGTDYHVHANPGKHPETRAKLNGAVSRNLDEMEHEYQQANFDHEEYYERKYGRAKR